MAHLGAHGERVVGDELEELGEVFALPGARDVHGGAGQGVRPHFLHIVRDDEVVPGPWSKGGDRG